MPYYKNEPARSGGSKYGHEAAVASVIQDAGFTSVDRSQFPKLTSSILFEWRDTGNDSTLRTITEGLLPGSYILQPAGSQSPPDILVKDFNDRFVAIECKSVEKNTCPMWNDNLPKSDFIYVLASGITNTTTVFFGKDVISPNIIILQQQMWAEVKAVIDKWNAQIQTEDDATYSRGWLVKARPQNFQQGGAAKTNYFTHNGRSQCEANVLDYVKL